MHLLYCWHILLFFTTKPELFSFWYTGEIFDVMMLQLGLLISPPIWDSLHAFVCQCMSHLTFIPSVILQSQTGFITVIQKYSRFLMSGCYSLVCLFDHQCGCLCQAILMIYQHHVHQEYVFLVTSYQQYVPGWWNSCSHLSITVVPSCGSGHFKCGSDCGLNSSLAFLPQCVIGISLSIGISRQFVWCICPK